MGLLAGDPPHPYTCTYRARHVTAPVPSPGRAMGRYASRFELRLGESDELALRDAAARFGMGRAELVRTLVRAAAQSDAGDAGVFANVGVDGTLSRFSTLRSWAC